MPPIIFLFDIDGTLLLTGGAGSRAMHRTMKDEYQLDELAKLEVHGRTDRSIIGDLFAAHEIELDDDRYQSFRNSYHEYLVEEIRHSSGEPLPGVQQCLELLHGIPDVHIGLLTGNSRKAARVKTDHYQLSQWIQDFGGFGDLHFNRNDVAADAIQSCNEYLGTDMDPRNVWVIGDTIHDIACARSVQANVIAVETGGVAVEELQDAKPDLLLTDLTAHEEILNVTGLDAIRARRVSE